MNHKRKNFIITCDDFGMHESINLAAFKTYKNGNLDQVSLVANGEAFDNAIDLLKKMPKIKVGFHFNIIEGRPIAPPKNVSSLIDKDNLFFNSVNKFFFLSILAKIKYSDIKNEFEAQLSKILQNDINISYLDSHRHLHFFPPIVKTIIPLMEKNCIGKVRNVSPPLFSLNINPTKLATLFIFEISKHLYGNGKMNTDRFLGFFQSGNIKKKDIIHWFKNINKKQSYEISLHLGTDNELLEKYFSWKKKGFNANWESEFNTINSNEIRQLWREKL